MVCDKREILLAIRVNRLLLRPFQAEAETEAETEAKTEAEP